LIGSRRGDRIALMMEERRRQRNGTNRTDGTHGPQEPRIIPPHGGYHNLKSYQVAEIVFDATNALICLINQANFLLDRQLASLEQTFLNEGGFTERLYPVYFIDFRCILVDKWPNCL